MNSLHRVSDSTKQFLEQSSLDSHNNLYFIENNNNFVYNSLDIHLFSTIMKVFAHTAWISCENEERQWLDHQTGEPN